MTETDILKFKKLGIRSIIDFRSAKEYSKANGNKLLDAYYPVCKVHINMFGRLVIFSVTFGTSSFFLSYVMCVG